MQEPTEELQFAYDQGASSDPDELPDPSLLAGDDNQDRYLLLAGQRNSPMTRNIAVHDLLRAERRSDPLDLIGWGKRNDAAHGLILGGKRNDAALNLLRVGRRNTAVHDLTKGSKKPKDESAGKQKRKFLPEFETSFE